LIWASRKQWAMSLLPEAVRAPVPKPAVIPQQAEPRLQPRPDGAGAEHAKAAGVLQASADSKKSILPGRGGCSFLLLRLAPAVATVAVW
jgi:hypothetical protein